MTFVPRFPQGSVLRTRRLSPLLLPALALCLLLPTSQAAAQDSVRCESRSHQTQRCNMDTRGGIELTRQFSHAGCWEGDTWGYDRRGVWVSNGCRAEFVQARGGGRYGGSQYADERYPQQRYDDRRDHHDDDNSGAIAGAVVLGLIGAALLADDHHDDRRDDGRQGGSITCESNDGRYKHCGARVGRGHVEIERVLSRAECRYGQSWGTDREGVWVDDGCRARFAIR